MQGTRLPDVTWDNRGGWAAWAHARPGDYVKVLNAPASIANPTTPGAGWYIRDPHGDVGSLSRHTIVEHEDGTITVTPSILNPRDGGYHGWLTRGVWTDA